MRAQLAHSGQKVLNRLLRGGKLHGHHQVLPSRQREERPQRLIGVPDQ